ncbi:MAG: rhomboid family intramembrane serine protease [Butyrivibrio sp.]|nr:rhomboid family intramembrane serine protease [Acetatifactor muris]MCM1559506.1 rhomboid family intramembrane serine protease [Butyrivibrio sp.]
MRRWKELPIVSGALVAANIAVYILCTFTGSRLYRLGNLNVADVVVNHEYGRVLWAMFLHSGVSHIFNNMLILFFLGAMIEKEIGHVCYALLYFFSGIGGNLASLLAKVMNHDISASIGASGAVFGLDGVLLAMVFFSDRKMPTVTPARVMLMILLSLYNGFSGENIDNAAHLGGLVAGFLGGCAVCVIQRARDRRRR